MMIAVAALVCVGGIAFVKADEPPTMDGTWVVTRFDNATGDKFAGLELILKSDGEMLRGTIVWPDGKETPIAAGRIINGEVSFKVRPGSVTQDYRGEFEGDVIRGRWAAGIAAFDWEARRAADITASQLYGRWKFEHGALGEFDTLELHRNGRFQLEHRDIALGTTTTSGTWALDGSDVVLRQERDDVDGQKVEKGAAETETLRVRWTADGLRLGKPPREFRQISSDLKDDPAAPPAAKVGPSATAHEFVGVSEKRSLDEALADALRQMDDAVAKHGRQPCTPVSWRVAEISGRSGTPADLKRLEVRISATFEVHE